MVMHTKSRRVVRNQSGLVSIMVTMIMMLVITLIVLGFSQVSRREQRQSLDRQLSTQAFFAAESAVNDARQKIKQDIVATGEAHEKTVCEPDSNYTTSATIDTANEVSYPCLLVSTRLNSLTASVSAGGRSINIPIEPSGTMQRLHINWNAAPAPTNQGDVASNCQSNNKFQAKNDWDCPYGLLRADIVPTGPPLSRDSMQTGQRTMFFYPTPNASTFSQDWATANGAIPELACKVETGCDIDINGIPSGNYALRLSSQYKSGVVTITAYGAGTTPLELRNAQILIDATGKARDVMRRIQVRLPLTPSGATPDYAIESASSICKRFEVSGTTFSIPNTVKGQDPNNPMCQPM